MRVHALKLTSALVALTIAQLAHAAPQDAEADQATATAVEEVAVDEIVVTATRRNAGVNSIPLSISALAPEDLANRGIRSIENIASTSPGLSIISDSGGAETLSIRGIIAQGSVATTAIYIDETPIAQLGGATFSPRYFDIERVEVLRGPQGTLYGASSLGGGVRIITAKPILSKIEGAVRVEGSTTRLGKANGIFDGALNIPIVNDLLALRVTGFYENRSGWIRNFRSILSLNPADYVDADGNPGIAYTGFVPDTGRRTGGEEVFGGRAALRAQPSEAISLTGSYSWQQRRNNGGNTADVSVGLGLNGTQLRQATAIQGFQSLRSQLANFTADIDVGFAKLTSSTSFEWNRQTAERDISAFLLPGLIAQPDLAVVPVDSLGRVGATSAIPQNKRSFTQEVRLVSQGDGPLNWIIGGFYNRTRLNELQNFTIFGLTDLVGPELAPQDNFGTISLLETRREFSVFGEVGYDITDQITATLGLRRYDVQIGSQTSSTGLVSQGATISSPLPVTDRGFTYKAVVNYKPSSNILLFAGYTTGYRPGGVNPVNVQGEPTPPGFRSDRLAQYELGWKTRFLDRALTFNGAVFYIDWRDIPTTASTPSGNIFTFNGPRARTVGGEVEFVARPIDGLDITIGATILDAKYRTSLIEQGITRGDRLPNVPRYSANAAFNYEWSVGGDIRARVSGDVSLVSNRRSLVTDRDSTLPDSVTAGLSAGLNFGSFDLSIFARNLFDERALVGNFNAGQEISGGQLFTTRRLSYSQPRTIGASIQFKF